MSAQRRLLKIDDLTRRDHYYLDPSDQCYYLGEYTARQGYGYSVTNQLIFNLKKSPDRRDRPLEWRHKERAIATVASDLRHIFKMDKVAASTTLVPIPPSKAKADPLYDDRMLRVLQEMCQGYNADIRELVLLQDSIDSSHSIDNRPPPDKLMESYYIDETVAEPAPKLVFIFDDVLTTGSHFKAVDGMLKSRFPGVETVGIFVARRAPDTTDIVHFDPIS